jgi:hypothetical protein
MTFTLPQLNARTGFARHFPESVAVNQRGILPCGIPALARELPMGGWPASGVTELLSVRTGRGELNLLLPALAALTQSGRQIMLIDPPQVPEAQGWAAQGVQPEALSWAPVTSGTDRLEVIRRMLPRVAGGALVIWWREALQLPVAEALQSLARQYGVALFLLRQCEAWPATGTFPLRLWITPGALGLTVMVQPARSRAAGATVFLPRASASVRSKMVTVLH